MGRTPSLGKIPVQVAADRPVRHVQLLADLPVAELFGGAGRAICSSCGASRSSARGEQLAAALAGARKAVAI